VRAPWARERETFHLNYTTEEKAGSVPPRLENGGPGNGARVQVTPLPPNFLEATRIVSWPHTPGKRAVRNGVAGAAPAASAMEATWIVGGHTRLLNAPPRKGCCRGSTGRFRQNSINRRSTRSG